jgi:para-nitrobenzyl esterase
MNDAGIAVARTGDPNTAGLPRWRPYTADDRATMLFSDRPEIGVDPIHPEIRRLWSRVQGARPA